MRFLGRFLFAVTLVTSMAVPASGQTVDQAFFQAGFRLTAAVSSEGLSAGKKIGIVKFRDRIGVTCEPMATVLTNKMRTTLIHQIKQMQFTTEVVETVDPGTVDAVISGEWFNAGDGKVALAIKLGDVTSLEFRDISMAEARFDEASLSPEARKCLLEFDAVEREVEIKRAFVVRASPSSVGKQVDKLPRGTTVWVSARVVSKGNEGWFVVRLPDDEDMPVGMRERRGFVYKLSLDFIDIEDMDAWFVATKTVKLRTQPKLTSEILDKFPANEAFHATGKVRQKKWYRVAWKGEAAFVLMSGLKEVDEGEVEAWNTVKNSEDREAVLAFLTAWPKGHFKQHAEERLKALQPELEVKVWTERKAYHKGEFIRIFLSGSKNFYAKVVYRDAEGNLVQLLPNAYRDENHFEAGKTYTVPDDEDRFDLEVGPPFGNERILVFASTAPLPKMTGDDIGRGLVLLRGGVDGIRERFRGVGIVAKGSGAEGERVLVEATSDLRTKP